MWLKIADWDNAYANTPNIPGGERWPALWAEPAKVYREAMVRGGRARLDMAYGTGARNVLDLFLPEGTPKGAVVFVHGGFWMKLDKSYWSHLARGAIDRGYAVAIPSYSLCPEVRIPAITIEIAKAVGKVMDLVAGPATLIGHSAGGHLVTRMICRDGPLDATRTRRIARVVSVSGLHDLRPLLHTRMNATLQLDPASARAESAALAEPVDDARVVCVVGGAERAEFRRQSQLLANIWTGLGAATAYLERPDRHHYDVLDEMQDSDSVIVAAALTGQ